MQRRIDRISQNEVETEKYITGRKQKEGKSPGKDRRDGGNHRSSRLE